MFSRQEAEKGDKMELYRSVQLISHVLSSVEYL